MLPEEIKNKRVLLSPLNWGMGHVSRCIPIVHQLINQENEVFIACNGHQQAIFEMYFSKVIFISHEGYPFRFSGRGKFRLDIIRSLTGLFRRLKAEKKEAREYVQKYHIDVIISDHRYGFRMENLPSIIICHQLNLPVRRLENPVNFFHRRLLRKFDMIWVPDFGDSLLAGKLSQNRSNLDTNYIGPQSRFKLYNIPHDKQVERVVVISGPSVYARQFYSMQRERYKLDDENTIFLCSPDNSFNEIVEPLSDWRSIDEEIMKAKFLISRSGYSTIMDLYFLQIPFEIIPTPGQSEQEYLGKVHYRDELIRKNFIE